MITGRSPWLTAIVLGALIGAVCLGVGGRIAMRMVALLEHRPLQVSTEGILHVLAFGAGFGALAGCCRAGIDMIPRLRLPERFRAPVFMLLCLSLGLTILTPLTLHRLVLFPPLIALYVVAFEVIWRRKTLATRIQPM